MSDDAYQPGMTPDGKINPKFVDLLEEDKPRQPKFVCVFFVSPDLKIRISSTSKSS